jgi:hypothetical protein
MLNIPHNIFIYMFMWYYMIMWWQFICRMVKYISSVACVVPGTAPISLIWVYYGDFVMFYCI